mgnify:CR=1 FL=1
MRRREKEIAPLSYMDKDETTASWDEAIPDALVALFTVAGGMGTSGDLTPLANETRTPDNSYFSSTILAECSSPSAFMREK